MSVQRSRSAIQPTSVGDELPESGMAGRVITGTDGPFRYLAESSRVFDPPEAVADRLTRAGFMSLAFQPLTLGIAVICSGRKPTEVPNAADGR